MKPAFFESAADFRAWLACHHATDRELLLGFCKKAARRGITYQEVLDEALSFGWIDGVRRRLSPEAYTIRFSPRKPGSVWSVSNTRRAEELISQGLMKPSGLRAFRDRDPARTRQYSYERDAAALDPPLESALRTNPKAARFFDAQPPGYRKTAVHWVVSAKKQETRARRLERLIECSAQGARLNLLSPNRS